MTDDLVQLRLLADRAGIEPKYRDAHGVVRVTTPETLRLLLASMGIAASDETEIAESLRRMDSDAWGRALPHVAVVHEGRGEIAVRLTLQTPERPISWRLTLEDGAVLTGQCDFASLRLLDTSGKFECRELVIAGRIAFGYHRLVVSADPRAMTLIVTPGKCWLPQGFEKGGQLGGISAQLYLLRSERNWGIGDFGDLARLVRMTAAHGGDVVGLNPLHLLFPDEPEHASPYSPASRDGLNILYIDVPSLPEFAASNAAQSFVQSESFQSALAACRAARLVDYSAVMRLKLEALEYLYVSAKTATPEREAAFVQFCDKQGASLARTCLFLALREHFAVAGTPDWQTWPRAYRDPDSIEVLAFARDKADRIGFFAWLQWLADDQLALAASAAREAGMAVGLYRDLAVGAAMAGAETWANQAAVVSGAAVGVPPDIHNPAGQNWGLPPFNPIALQQEAYASFIRLVRSNMRHAGGLRIDHVMALQQTFWIPKGCLPGQGGYVRYPFDDLVGILALESQRNRCLVVGEDLGTVFEGFRERMMQAKILSYRVLIFERDDEGFLPPGRYPNLSVAVAGNHDLPAMQAWWSGADIRLRQRLGLYPDAATVDHAALLRKDDRRALATAFLREGWPVDAGDDAPSRLFEATRCFLERCRSFITLLQLDDVMNEQEPVNVPGTSTEHPNWRRKMAATLDEIERSGRLGRLAREKRPSRTVKP